MTALKDPSLRERTLSKDGKAGREPMVPLRSSGKDGTPLFVTNGADFGVSPSTVGTSLKPTLALFFFVIPSSEMREIELALVGARLDSAGEGPLREGFEGERDRGGGWWGTVGKGPSAK